MKITSPFKDFTTPEYFLFGLFVLYLVIPVKTPMMIHKFITNPIGLILLLTVVTAMFFMTPSILAIMFVLVIYELLRRDENSDNTYIRPSTQGDDRTQSYKYVSDNVVNESVHSKGEIMNHPSVSESYVAPKNEEVYLSVGDSLEENMVQKMAPVEYNSTTASSDFRPISENSLGGSNF